MLATIALLAVAGDAQGTLTPGRARAKRVCSKLARTLAPFVPGGIARYDEDWNPRAFGDNLTAWGTPVVLIESGALPAGGSFADLTRLNYVGAPERAPRARATTTSADEDAVALRGPRPQHRRPLRRRASWRAAASSSPRAPSPTGPTWPSTCSTTTRRRGVPGCPARPGPRASARWATRGCSAAARRRSAADRLLTPALAASVRGSAASSWLSADALDAVSRLGVARVRWHVAAADREAALQVAARLQAPAAPSSRWPSPQRPSTRS